MMIEIPFRDFMGHHAMLKSNIEFGFWVQRMRGSFGGTIWIDQIEAAYNPKYPLGATPFPSPYPIPGDRVTRINVGCFEDIVDEAGNLWLSDRGNYWGVANKDKFPFNRVQDLPKVPHRFIYETNRMGLDGYGFAVPNGEYLVKLYFHDAAMPAIMGLSVNGEKQPDVVRTWKFDKELIREIPLQVTDGRIHIEISDMILLSSINGIEIIPQFNK